MTWHVLIGLGLMFLAVSLAVPNPTGRIVSVVVAAVMFVLAVVVAVGGPVLAG